MVKIPPANPLPLPAFRPTPHIPPTMLSRSALARAGCALSLRATRPFSSSSAAREHFLNAGPELFETHAVKGDTVTLVDFYAE